MPSRDSLVRRRFGAALSSAVSSALMLAAQTAGAATPDQPVVVELFQSQGCSSCPPTNANVMALSQRPDVLTLSFQVTYWDDLGWKDTFAKPPFTDRQWAYAHALGHSNVFTPQVVVDGRVDGVGNDPGELRALVRAGARPGPGPAIAITADAVAVGAGPAPKTGADVWLVRYDPRVIQVPIRRGENGGRTLPHKNVVREIVRLGPWNGQPARFHLTPPAGAAWRDAVLVQTAGAGPILAAAHS
jgi:hypothetical protein